MAQVDEEGRQPDHQHAGGARHQTDADELAGTGEDSQRHQLPLPWREMRGWRQRTEDDRKRRSAHQHGQRIAHASGEFGGAGVVGHGYARGAR